MGIIQSCIGKRSNKVDVMSEEEAEAYSKMEEEIKKELVTNIHTKPLPWMMFCTEPNTTKPQADEVHGDDRDKLLVDKHEKAKIRRERIIQEKKLSAQRPRTAPPGPEMSLKALILRKIKQTKTTI